MSTLDSDTHLLNEINTPNPRENCDYIHNLEYTLDLPGEAIVSFDVTENELPHGLVLNGSTGEISGNVISPDDWDTEVSNYILQVYDEMDDSETPFPDIPELTVGELKSLDVIHLSGINYGIKGMKAYHRDNENGGLLSQFYFTITLTTTYASGINETSKEFYIQVAPHIDPKTFILNYENSNNNLVDDDMNSLTGQQYIDWRESQGHVFLSGCNY